MSKRSEELKTLIIQAIEETGLNKEAIKVASEVSNGFTQRSFYRWKAEDVTFSQEVAKAHKTYRNRLAEQTRTKARKSIAEIVEYGWQERWDKKEEYRDAEGNLTGSKSSSVVVTKPLPAWVADKILGSSNVSEIQALQVLAEAQMLPYKAVESASEHLESMKNDITKQITGAGDETE